MFSFLSEPSFTACSECGASVARGRAGEHTCDEERRLDFQLFQLRRGIAAFDDDLNAFLASAAGRFEVWYAERTRPTLQES